jgi:carboxylesterase type B
LTFTKKVIGGFGGDPNRITVAGQSSGAHMIRGLLASPKAAGLFQNAILQSDPMVRANDACLPLACLC